MVIQTQLMAIGELHGATRTSQAWMHLHLATGQKILIVADNIKSLREREETLKTRMFETAIFVLKNDTTPVKSCEAIIFGNKLGIQ